MGAGERDDDTMAHISEDTMDADEDGDAELQGASLQAYEREYNDERSWEELEEDEGGRLRALDPAVQQRAKRARLQAASASARVRRGMMRYLYVVLDVSRATLMTDMRPTRLAVLSNLMQGFIREFFDQNPLSQLGLILARNGIAERITELSGSPEAHIAALKERLEVGGDMSLQNALDLAHTPLSNVPQYGTREMLLLVTALSTCDPGDVFASVAACKKAKVRCSVLGVAAEMHLCRTIATSTGGSYEVARDETHLHNLLMEFALPPPSLAEQTPSSLVNMGFPARGASGTPAMCACHREVRPGPHYTCPRCKSRVCDLPTPCPVCNITLVSSPHLARSYHHLFPVPTFQECPNAAAEAACFACCTPLQEAVPAGDAAVRRNVVLRCGRCTQLFCVECDLLIHDALHNCPGCEFASTGSLPAT